MKTMKKKEKKMQAVAPPVKMQKGGKKMMGKSC